jgi:dolichol-phosphate mannosyltransferase
MKVESGSANRVSRPAEPTEAERGEHVPLLSLAVPCYNEAESIRNTATRLVESFHHRHLDLELVLVDNGSADETGAIIDRLAAEGLPVVKEVVAVNQGYGYGVLRGLARCRGRFVGFICADGQVDADDVAKLFEIALNAKSPKLVKVRRRFRMDGFTRKMVSIFYNGFANVLFGGLGTIDINGNPKIMPRDAYERMNLHSCDWFLDAEVMIKAKRIGLPVFEMNVLGQMREGGSSNVRASTCWEFLRNLARARFGRLGPSTEDLGVPAASHLPSPRA